MHPTDSVTGAVERAMRRTLALPSH